MSKTPRKRPAARLAAWVLGLLGALVCLAPAAVPAATTDAGTGPEFFLETIVVEGAERFAPEIIVSESLLQPGRSYSERQLRDAVHRIVRLPLVLDADFALRRGSERGAYELVITVEESLRWFLSWDLLTGTGDDLFFIEGLDSPEEPDDLSLFLGWRMAAGRHGVLNVAVDPLADGAVQVGYTHYNLLRRSIQLSLAYLVEPLAADPLDEESRTARLSLGVPIAGNHSLLLSGSRRTGEFTLGPASREGFQRENERVLANLSWVFNTIDDPIFPSSGWFVRGGVEYRSEEQKLREAIPGSTSGFFIDFIRIAVPRRTESRRLVVAVDRYWSPTPDDALSVAIDLAAGEASIDGLSLGNVLIDAEVDLWETRLTLGYARFVWRDQRRPRWRELRWESEVEGFREGTSPAFSLPGNPRSGYRVATGFRFRSTWGVFRARFDYFEDRSASS